MNKYLIASIWIIAVAAILLLCGSIIGGMGTFLDIGNWFSASHTLTDSVGIALIWGGIILFIIGVFGIATSLLKGHQDKPQQKTTPVPQP
jgi:hypothetical protein